MGLLTRAVSTSDVIGWLAGALLFPIEVALCSLLREGPSTEMMVCRRIEQPAGTACSEVSSAPAVPARSPARLRPVISTPHIGLQKSSM